MSIKRVFITGGHFSPAYAVISELSHRGGWEIFYLGRKYAMEDDQAEALEYQEIRKLPSVTYLIITTGRLQPKFFVNVVQSIRALSKIFIGLWQALFWIIRFRPDVVLSFGGYIAVPVVFWAWLFGLPVATHEQTVVSGKANKLLALLSDAVLVSWPQSLNHFPKNKTILTGNPIREEILAARPAKNKRPVIYVTGGNQGAHVLNVAIEAVLSKLLANYEVIHQTGDAGQFADFPRLLKNHFKNYHVAKFLSASEAASALSRADLVVTRAGANTVKEILALGKMALFVPLPWSGNSEQQKNAEMVKKVGLAEILPQDRLTGPVLFNLVKKMLKNKERYRQNAAEASKLLIPDAAKKVVDQVVKLTL